jgi:DNA primase
VTAAGKRKISAELLKKIKDAVNLVDVVGEHVVLRKSGSNHTGLCPFHSERSPSFSVSEQKQLYHCYGCKKGGDLVNFMMEIHSLSFPEAIEELAMRAKVALPKDWDGGGDSADPETQKRRAAAQEKAHTAFKLNRFAAAFFHGSLPRTPHIAQYFNARGICSPDLQRSFYLGAAPASWDALARHLVAKKAPLDLAVELGLIKPSQKQQKEGPAYFDLFRNRAIFPILDTRGRVAGFGGRALPLPAGAPDVGGESPKYLNSSESFIFHKSKIAYGLFQAQKHIREKDEIILVEGYFDVLALHAAGFENAVATCGTALTPDHLAVFRRIASKVTVLFDGDRAGISATERAMEVGLDQGMVLSGAVMPEGLDPDEVLFDDLTGQPRPEGKERMAAILAAARPLLDSRIEQLGEEARRDPEAKTQAVKQVAQWLGRFRDPVGREIRLEAAVARLGVPRTLLDKALQLAPQPRGGGSPAPVGGGSPAAGSGPARAQRPQFQTQPHPPRPAPAGGSGAPRGPRPQGGKPPAQPKLGAREVAMLKGLIHGGPHTPLMDQIRSKLPPRMTISDLFDYPPARAFVALLADEPGEWAAFRDDAQAYLDEGTDPQVRSIVMEALLAAEPPVVESDLRRACEVGLSHAWARFSQQIKAALADAEAKQDEGLRAKLLEEYLDVQRRMKEFSVFYDEA